MPFWSRRKPAADPELSQRLRAQALTHPARDVGLAPSPEHPNVFAILMETRFEKGAATLAVFLDGATSLYFSSGGGIIGAGEHEAVRRTHGAFFAEAEAKLSAFSPATATPLPGLDRVRFYLRTFDGTLTAEAAQRDLASMTHPLSDLFRRGHDVITAVREATGGSAGAA